MDIELELKKFTGRDGRIWLWPVKAAKQKIVLGFLASRFERKREYSEKEVNEILNHHHSFGDPALLRRELIVKGLMERKPDGSRYWLVLEDDD